MIAKCSEQQGHPENGYPQVAVKRTHRRTSLSAAVPTQTHFKVIPDFRKSFQLSREARHRKSRLTRKRCKAAGRWSSHSGAWMASHLPLDGESADLAVSNREGCSPAKLRAGGRATALK